jgi:hypothetical protein
MDRADSFSRQLPPRLAPFLDDAFVVLLHRGSGGPVVEAIFRLPPGHGGGRSPLVSIEGGVSLLLRKEGSLEGDD